MAMLGLAFINIKFLFGGLVLAYGFSETLKKIYYFEKDMVFKGVGSPSTSNKTSNLNENLGTKLFN